MIYFDQSVLDSNDERIRTIPFTTKRPTNAEVLRCFNELITIRVKEKPVEIVGELDQELSKTIIKVKSLKIDEKSKLDN